MAKLLTEEILSGKDLGRRNLKGLQN